MNNAFHAAAAEAVITPPVGTPLAGNLTPVISTHVTDDLYVRVVLLQNASTQLAFVLLDMIGISNEDARLMENVVAEAAQMPAANVCVCCTHTHFGPCTLEMFHARRDDAFMDNAISQLRQAVSQARENLRPAKAAWGIGHEPTSAFNRRYHMSDGTLEFNPGVQNPRILRVAGPTDPEVPVLLIDGEEGQPIAVIANFSMHYIGDQDGFGICADYFGLFAEQIKEKYGAQCIGLLTHGFSGDINSCDVRGEEALPPREKSRHIVGLLMDEIEKVRRDAVFHDAPFLLSTRDTVPVGVRKISGPDLDEQRALAEGGPLKAVGEGNISQHVSRAWSQEIHRAYAQERLILLEWPDEFPVTLGVLRVGDYAAVTMPGEMFCRLGIDLKYASPFAVTAPIELANGYSGYTPTLTDYELGGYETWLARSSFVTPGSGEKMVVEGAKLLRRAWREHPERSAGSG